MLGKDEFVFTLFTKKMLAVKDTSLKFFCVLKEALLKKKNMSIALPEIMN